MTTQLERTHQGVDPVWASIWTQFSLALILAIQDRHERINTDLLVRKRITTPSQYYYCARKWQSVEALELKKVQPALTMLANTSSMTIKCITWEPNADLNSSIRLSASTRLPLYGFTYYWTLSSKFFSTFPHGTCSLSVSRRYLALDGVYHPS